MARSLNKVLLIGNLTRDPELRYTPQGTAVCTFGLATNRQWKTDSGDSKEDAEFHKCVAWNQLAEVCAKLLKKGRKIYIEGRLQTRSWQAQDGAQRSTTEIVVSDMILLDSRNPAEGASSELDVPADLEAPASIPTQSEPAPAVSQEEPAKKTKGKKESKAKNEKEVKEEDIPF